MLFKGLFLAALPAAFAAPAPGTVQVPTSDGPAPPSGVTIEGISYAGSGCNAGSVAGAISNDLSTVTLLYDSFIAQAGSGIQPAEARKNCQLNLQLKLPQGWQFSVFKADYRGYAYLQKGDKGVIKSTYYFSGDSTQVSAQQTLKGDYDDNYLKTDEFGLESTVWSPCGEEGLLNVNSEVRVTPLNTNNTALLTVDSTDLKFTQIHYLQWQECDPNHG
ncbi:secreted protein [Seiridium cupressi]